MYDVLILVSEQKKAIHLNTHDIVTLPTNKKSTDKNKLYYDFWPYINNTSGILYKIYTKQGLGKFECGDELFEYSSSVLSNDDIPYFFTDDPDIIRDDLISISISSLYKKSFFNIIKLFLSKSPINTLLFLCRGQSNEKEIVLGKIGINKFSEMITNGQIFTNICYIIGE